MSIASDHVAFFQTERAARRNSTIVIKRVATNVLNTTTGVYAPTYDTKFSGPALIRPASATAVDSGQRQAELKFYEVELVYSETDPLPDDLVDVTSSPDPLLTGKQFVVRNVEGDDYPVRRLLWCEEVVNG